MRTEEILHTTQHRNYPLPAGPWIMKQSWHELLFAHWPIAPASLQALMPPAFKVDTFEGEAWVGIVPFRMSDVRPRGLFAVPALSAFPELNVRTYVSLDGRPGVYFFSLEAGNPIAVALARSIFHLPYYNALMRTQRIDNTINYRSQRTHRGAPSADFIGRYRPTGEVNYAQRHSIESWLTDRYCLYTNLGSHLYRADIHHLPWPLQPAEMETTRDTMAASHNIHLPDTDPLLYYSQHLDVLIWPIQRIQ
ncbi:YqjF family protein [Dictyobacter aurantiacus]|uniref:DUF2071 domain-containing protein n=1 Tax=Dictyobacter aurantiacus TaxID=1936993 RepID=A0A401ZPG4_9CHLR|nr:DUF2071 domain-containing protein [Dictyobacter aurantiacus]GCE08757.1 hypothetical protein KDAU_60860 [Dictyobacter aurantiacus]